MKIGVTGYRGRLGTYLLNAYPTRFFPLECDVTKADDVEKCIVNTRPDLVLHLASKSDVDFCENPKHEKIVTQVNVFGTFNVASAAEVIGCPVILLSSAYVFSGKKLFGKYKEGDKPDPVNFYGYSKMGAESLVSVFDNLQVIRTSYLFDQERMSHFLERYVAGKSQDFPTFIRRSFIYIPHFAKALLYYFDNLDKMPYMLHIAGSESASWYDFVSKFFYDMTMDTNKILPRRQENDAYAPRGKNLGLDVTLSARLGVPQFSYFEGIRTMIS